MRYHLPGFGETKGCWPSRTRPLSTLRETWLSDFPLSRQCGFWPSDLFPLSTGWLSVFLSFSRFWNAWASDPTPPLSRFWRLLSVSLLFSEFWIGWTCWSDSLSFSTLWTAWHEPLPLSMFWSSFAIWLRRSFRKFSRVVNFVSAEDVEFVPCLCSRRRVV